MASRKDSERREGLLPLALAAMEAAVRRAPDITGNDDEAAALARSCSGSSALMAVRAEAYAAAWQLLRRAGSWSCSGLGAGCELCHHCAGCKGAAHLAGKGFCGGGHATLGEHRAVGKPRRLLQHPSCPGYLCCTPRARNV